MKTGQSKTCAKNSEISIEISDDMVVTSLSCATIINEILKNLLYQKSQIPYTYNRLKTIINRKRSCTKTEQINTIKNFTVTNHYRIVSSFYDNLEVLMLNLCKLFQLLSKPSVISEILFVLGTTPICPREIFNIRLEDLIDGHLDDYHLLECKRNQHKVLRKIFLSETWLESTANQSVLPCMNLYLFLKTTKNIQSTIENTIFVPCKPLLVNPTTRCFTVDLKIDNTRKYNCCGNLEIFNDDQTDSNVVLSSISDDIVDQEEFWYQSKISLQGFKDCFINKVSASELW